MNSPIASTKATITKIYWLNRTDEWGYEGQGSIECILSDGAKVWLAIKWDGSERYINKLYWTAKEIVSDREERPRWHIEAQDIVEITRQMREHVAANGVNWSAEHQRLAKDAADEEWRRKNTEARNLRTGALLTLPSTYPMDVHGRKGRGDSWEDGE